MTGPIVNGEQFAPGYAREAAEYEQSTRTGLTLPLTVPQAIRLHGDITERIARDRHKLDLLAAMRAAITSEPDPLSEGLLAANIRDYECLLARLGALLYGETP